ncbi:hypothetical protein HH303_00380 [Rhodospirillaceae bacterium KN72]|uniref:Uncharacterized protein n=1 Tax=Pacificispira spongiicola TaxID=2729598 RepID=A0A7Y0DWK5_9PROT|nr:hypothetical protein [Pacificispira spongiicola]NMM42913.1 hypothetical protein [Pacificispira spongiicola]
MAITAIHSFLVHPLKGAKNPFKVGGTEVTFSGKLYDLLDEVYTRSESECSIPIAFRMSEDGTQTNRCRTIIQDHLKHENLTTGSAIAKRLSENTTKRSSLGLLFLICGNEVGASPYKKLVISRFPVNSAILAEENSEKLSIEFLERVFMRSAHAYKSVLYKDSSIDHGFWKGHAVDRQVNSGDIETSAYWINDFLDSEYATTPKQGTMRLASAFRKATQVTDDLDIKQELTAASILFKNFDGQTLSAESALSSLGLSEKSRNLILSQFKNPSLAKERFTFNATLFSTETPYRSIQLDTGATLMAQTEKFDDLFKRTESDNEDQLVTYSTSGRITSERIEKRR